ncbi:MAG: hypothetical protein QNK36_10485 [Colwellia sp.]|nr:hypothetical protein [Colwellia sp.]
MSIDISDITPLDQYIATNLQTVFNVSWTAEVIGDVRVYARATGTVASDIDDLIAASNYTVTLVGGTLAVRVTFAVGRTTGDIVTITRDTPVTRDNLYINTNFTPTMLNSDFARTTMTEQENEMFHTSIGPRYNVSATLEPTIISGSPNPGSVDRILPILGTDQGWVKNTGGTAITAVDIPSQGVAPKDATYITQTANSQLDNEQALAALTTGFMASTTTTGVVETRTLTGTATTVGVTNGTGTGDPVFTIVDNPAIPGTAGMQLPTGTTAQRATPISPAINLRYNTDLVTVEYYDHGTSAWIGIDGVLLPVTDNAVARFDGTSGQLQNSAIYIVDTGRMGINNTAPGEKLTVTDSLTYVNNAQTVLVENTLAGEEAVLAIGATAANAAVGNKGAIYFDAGATGASSSNLLMLTANHQGSTIPHIAITGPGNVGIGTTTPTTKLDVVNAAVDTRIKVTTESPTHASIFLATGGDATTSGRFVYSAYQTLETVPQHWDVGMRGSKDYRIYDGIAAATRFLIDTSGNVGMGTTTPTHKLDVVGDQQITYTATEDDSHAMEINCHAAGYSGISALDIFYETGAQAAGTEDAALLISIDDTAAVGGEMYGVEVLVTPGASTVTALRAGALVNPLEQLAGTFGNTDSALNKAVDVQAALASGGAGAISGFVADNDTMTFGNATKYEEMSFEISTGASGSGIAPTFEYSTGVGTWATFGPTDGTNDFRNTGVIAWDNADLPTWAVGTGVEYLIRITRTRNNLTTTPIIDEVQLATVVEYGWDKDAVITAAQIGINNSSPSADVDVTGSINTTTGISTGISGTSSALNTDNTSNTNASTFNISKYITGGAAVVTFLQVTVPATTAFISIECTIINSRAPNTLVGTSFVQKKHFCIGRNGSGSDVILDALTGIDTVATSTSAGGTQHAVSGATTIVRNGAEANTASQVVNITINPGTTTASAGYALVKTEINYLGDQTGLVIA